MLHGVGRVGLPQKPRAHAGIGVELAVEDLDRELRLIAVRRGVDRRHAADSEDRVEPVLAAQDRPEAVVGLGREAWRSLHGDKPNDCVVVTLVTMLTVQAAVAGRRAM